MYCGSGGVFTRDRGGEKTGRRQKKGGERNEGANWNGLGKIGKQRLQEPMILAIGQEWAAKIGNRPKRKAFKLYEKKEGGGNKNCSGKKGSSRSKMGRREGIEKRSNAKRQRSRRSSCSREVQGDKNAKGRDLVSKNLKKVHRGCGLKEGGKRDLTQYPRSGKKLKKIKSPREEISGRYASK